MHKNNEKHKKCIEIWILSGYSPSREMCIIQFCALAEQQLLHDLVLSWGLLINDTTNVKFYMLNI